MSASTYRLEVGKKYRHCNGSVLFKCIAVFDDGDVVFANESGEKFVSPSGEAHLYVQVVSLPKPMEFYALLDRNDEWVGKTSREDGTGGRNIKYRVRVEFLERIES